MTPDGSAAESAGVRPPCTSMRSNATPIEAPFSEIGHAPNNVSRLPCPAPRLRAVVPSITANAVDAPREFVVADSLAVHHASEPLVAPSKLRPAERPVDLHFVVPSTAYELKWGAAERSQPDSREALWPEAQPARTVLNLAHATAKGCEPSR